MGFLDDISSAFSKGTARVEDGAKTLKLKTDMADARNRRDRMMAELGRQLYPIVSGSPEFTVGREQLFADIAAVDGEIAAIEGQIAEVERLAAERRAKEQAEAQARAEQQRAAAAAAAQQRAAAAAAVQAAGVPQVPGAPGAPVPQSPAVPHDPATPHAPAVPASPEGYATVPQPQEASCPQCGSGVTATAVFCSNCGSKLDAPDPTPAPAPAPAPQRPGN